MKVNFLDSKVEEFISSLEKPTVAKVLRTIDLLEMFGYSLRLPHSKRIRKNLYELRIRGKQEVRILYTFHKDEGILLHGFLKKSQRIPPKELQIAVLKLNMLDSV